MNDPFRTFGWVAIGLILVIFLLLAFQHVNCGHIDLGFFKTWSCGVSTVR